MKQPETSVLSVDQLLAPGQSITNPAQLLTYETDASFDHHMPDAVCFPVTTQDVLKLANWSKEHGVPLIARGSGTGLSGGAVPERAQSCTEGRN